MDIKRIGIYIYSFILGLFGFSMLGQYLQVNVLNFHFYFVEIYFLPAILMSFSNILSCFNVLLERMWNIIPQGLVGLVEGGLEYSYYIDVPPSYLIDIFGSMATALIVVYFSIQFILQAKLKSPNLEVKDLAIWLLPLFGMLLLTNGTFMVNTSQAIISGTIIGHVIKKAESVSRKHEYF